MRCKYCRQRIYSCDKCEQAFRLNDEILCITECLINIARSSFDDIFTSHLHAWKCSSMISVAHSEVIE